MLLPLVMGTNKEPEHTWRFSTDLLVLLAIGSTKTMVTGERLSMAEMEIDYRYAGSIDCGHNKQHAIR